MKPDLTVLGKIIGGGLPVGAFGGRAEIMDQLSPDGPVYQAGTLSGNPIAMAAGLAQLRELERIDGWKLLEELGAQFEALARDAIKNAKIDITFHRLGSMFCLFFAAAPIVDLASAQRSDLKMFARFFHACLKRGVYFAPSQFETGFISTAHTVGRHRAHGRCRARSIDKPVAVGVPPAIRCPLHVGKRTSWLCSVG